MFKRHNEVIKLAEKLENKYAGIFDIFKGYGEKEKRLAKLDAKELGRLLFLEYKEAFIADGFADGNKVRETRAHHQRIYDAIRDIDIGKVSKVSEVKQKLWEDWLTKEMPKESKLLSERQRIERNREKNKEEFAEKMDRKYRAEEEDDSNRRAKMREIQDKTAEAWKIWKERAESEGRDIQSIMNELRDTSNPTEYTRIKNRVEQLEKQFYDRYKVSYKYDMGGSDFADEYIRRWGL